MKPLYYLALMPLPLFLPYLWLDNFYFWGNPDSIFYVNAYTSYRDALWQGEIFPHWIASANIGLGSLAFYSLSPLAYSITALLTAPLALLNLSDNGQFLLGLYASQCFGAWAMWHWLKRHYDGRTALLGALVYTLIPYKLIVLYQHFNLAQCWAMALLPLWMLAAEGIASRRGQVMYAGMAALCFYAHPLTVVSMGPVALAYALYCAQWRWRAIAKPLLLAHVFALLLTASYLAAMLTALPWMQFRHWSGELFNALDNLYHIDDFLGLYAPLLLWLAWRLRRDFPEKTGTLYFWGGVLAALYVIATPLSYPLWALIPFMNVFQFPFARLQPGMAVAVTMLCAVLLAPRIREYRIAVTALLLLFAALCLLRLHLVYNRPHTVTPPIYEMARQSLMIPASVYMPVWTPLLPNDLLLHHDSFRAMGRAEVKYGEALAEVVAEGNGWMHLKVKVESPVATLVVSQFYVPAWHAVTEKGPVMLAPYPNGLIKIGLPKGEYNLRLELEKTAPEILGDLLTLLALAAIPLLLRRSYAFKTS